MNLLTPLTASLLALSPLLVQAAPSSWQDADLGSPGTPGAHQEIPGGLSVTGAGTGNATKGDQLHFTYKTLPAGDVAVVVRVVSLTGEPGKARGGIMLRVNNDPTSTRAEAVFSISKTGANGTSFLYHDPASAHGGDAGGAVTTMTLPLYLRLSRVGNDFAVDRSQDGKTWVQISNAGGGAFTPTGPIEVGFFAYSGDPAATATIKLDQITVGKPKLAYHSSWIGDTYGQVSTGHVSNGISALWVNSDGTCFTNSFWDEGGAAAKIYKDGKVVTDFRKENEGIGNNSCAEGSITGDGTNTYLVAGHVIYMSDLLAQKAATHMIAFASSLWDDKKKQSSVVGMAAVNGELFVSDSVEQKIRVASAGSAKKPLYSAGNTTDVHTDQAIDTAGVTNAAPMEVYQSQRETDYLPYQIPGLDPKTEYTVRLHFADYKYDKAGQRVMNVSAGGQKATFDIAAVAGAKNKAAVLELPHALTDANGVMAVGVVHTADSPDKHIELCGIEILKADGSQAFALNCGGGKVGSFQSEVNEMPERAFDFPRPGPITADKRGDLWIIQHPVVASADDATIKPEPAAIKCYHVDGTFTNKQIADVVNPTALAYDAAKDQLLVAENGPDQNVRIYENLATTPSYAKSFGVKGGLYAGDHPGLISDPAAGGDARFYGLTGVGIDAQGNIYVSSNSSGTDLRKFTPDGKLVWMLNGLHFVDCAAVDPDSDGTAVYCPFKHYTMDYTKTAPGSEWKYTAYTWNPFKYGPPQRGNVSSAILARLGPKRALMLYTSGQGQVGYIGIYRFDGEITVPAAKLSPGKAGKIDVWIDQNGDGLETPDEVTSCPGTLGSYSVDQKGDIWIAMGGAGVPTILHFFFHGLNDHGAPIYGTNPGDYETIPFPDQRGILWGNIARVYYDSERDVMYLIGPAQTRKTGKEDPINYLARYNDWSKGNRTALWMITLPDPYTDSNFMYTPPLPYGLAFQWQAMDVAVDKIFIAELWGPVHVFDAATGKQDIILNPGPEISGSSAWEDEQMGVHAFKRKNGEYVVFTENSGWGAKNNMFRWKPTASHSTKSK